MYICSVGMDNPTVRKKDFVFLLGLGLATIYCPVLYCATRKRSWLSLWLGLAVDILQFWNVYRTVREKALRVYSLGLG